MAEHGRRSTPLPRMANRLPTVRKTLRAKAPFDVDDMFARIERAIGDYKKAAMFDLAEQGYSSLFEQIVACIISIRTFDEVSAPVARKLFEVARTPAVIAKLGIPRIDELIHACTFHGPKA